MRRAVLLVALGCTPEESSKALPDPIVAKAPEPAIQVKCPPLLPAEGTACALTKPGACRYANGRLFTDEPAECICRACDCKDGKFHCRRHDIDE